MYQLLGMNFFLVVISQFFIFIATYALLKPKQSFSRLIFLGLIVGLPYGLLVDFFVGFDHSIFDYYGREKSWIFLIFNWLFSYGFFVSSVLCLTDRKGEPRSSLPFLVSSIGLVGTSLFFIYGIGVDSLILRMIFLGFLMVSLSEVVLFYAGQKGYLQHLVALELPVFRLWFFVAITGALYEGVNLLFPLWRWHNTFPSPEANLAIIAFFGYGALVYPVVAVKALLNKYGM